jgi:pimeloyl-ACP methyl ester carboxylesterase
MSGATESAGAVLSPPEPRRVAVDIDQGSLSVLVWDGPEPDAPVLHFAHANGFNGQTYRTLLAPLADRFRILAPDMRGHGATDLPALPAQHRSVLLFAEDIVRHLEAQGVTGAAPALLAGHSYGATASLFVASLRPDLVKGLVLLDPVILARRMHWMMRTRWGRDRLLKSMPIAANALKRRSVFESRDALFTSYKGRGAFKTWPDEVLRDYIDGGTRARADGQVELACSPEWEATNFVSHGKSPWGILKSVRAPVRLVLGEAGSTCAPAEADRLSRLKPGWQQDRLPGTTHFVPMEEPEAVRTQIATFWQEISASGSL